MRKILPIACRNSRYDNTRSDTLGKRVRIPTMEQKNDHETRADMNRLMDAGVDGIITDYPTRLRGVMADRDLKLPKQYHLK